MKISETSKLQAALDGNNYDESELISVKVKSPHLSCYSNSRLFERVDGQIEVDGVSYKFVKRRLFNDTLEFLCIPNHAIMLLQSANDNFFKLVNGLQHNFHGKKNNISSGSYNNPISEYYMLYVISLEKNKYFTSRIPIHPDFLLASCFLDVSAHPPEFIFSSKI